MSLAIVVVLASLTFVPISPPLSFAARQAQPRGKILGIPWTFLFVWVIWRLPQRRPDRGSTRSTLQLAWISLAVPLVLPGRLLGDQRGSLAQSVG